MFGHDDQKVIGRVSAGTCHFFEDQAGVHVEADGPETTWFSDLVVSMERQDLTQASAAFWILKASWQVRNGEKIRIIERALMREASIVAFAAYESTQAAIAAPAASTSTDAMGVRIELLRLEGIPFGQLTPEQQGRKIELLRISK